MNDFKGAAPTTAVGNSIKTQLAESQARVTRLTDQIDEQARIFDGIFSSISDFAYAFDRNGRFVFINKALLDLWGMELKDAVGKNFHELPYPDDLATKLQRQIQEVFDTGDRVVDETAYTNPEGKTGYYEYIFSPVTAPDGSIDLVSGSTRDITSRKLIEQRLAESEEQYRTLFNSIDEGFCIAEVIFDEQQNPIDYRFLEVNPSFVKQSGLENVVGKRVRAELVPDQEDFWFETYGHIALTGEPARFEHRTEPLDRWFDVFAFRIGDPNDRRIAIIFHDISERKRAESEINELNEQNREILESITDAFFALDAEWRFTYLNKQAEFLLSREPGDLTGKVIWDEYPGLIGSEFETAYRNAASDRIASTVTSYYPDHKRWYEVTTYPAKSGITVYFRNATERVERDEALRKSELELRQMDRRKDEFIATLAHELRNPLAPIRTGLEILRSASDPQGSATTLDMIERQTNQIVRLVDDLLDVSRITQGKIRLQKERIQIRQPIEMAIETSKREIDRSGNQLIVTLPYDPIYLDADLTRTSQIFLNVLNNAAKFSAAGGKIHVEVETIGGNAVVRIKDEGRGIAPDSLPKIFEIFGQVDTTEWRDRGGLGIGLSVVKQLVEMHGGTVEARSDGLGKGSEFIIRLPLAAISDQEIADQKSAGDVELILSHDAPQKVLVVDDNHDAAVMMETLLQLNGHDVRTSFDGASALEVAREFMPEICLLDIGMPGMSGWELARKLREFLPLSLLVSVSGWGQEQDRLRSKESGFDHHLVKPVEFDTLFALIGDAGKSGAGRKLDEAEKSPL